MLMLALDADSPAATRLLSTLALALCHASGVMFS